MKTFWSGDDLILDLETNLTLTNLSHVASPNQAGEKIKESRGIRLRDFQVCKNADVIGWRGSTFIPSENFPNCVGDEYNFSEDYWEEGEFMWLFIKNSERGTPQFTLEYGRGFSLTYQGEIPIPGR
ncbi:MAG: hypothetical protein WBB82_12885 [Limnothrix sp.]